MEHLEQHKLIEVMHHGSIPGRLYLTNLLAYLESMTKQIDSGLPVGTFYLEFGKVVDMVPYTLCDKSHPDVESIKPL